MQTLLHAKIWNGVPPNSNRKFVKQEDDFCSQVVCHCKDENWKQSDDQILRQNRRIIQNPHEKYPTKQIHHF